MAAERNTQRDRYILGGWGGWGVGGRTAALLIAEEVLLLFSKASGSSIVWKIFFTLLRACVYHSTVYYCIVLLTYF